MLIFKRMSMIEAMKLREIRRSLFPYNKGENTELGKVIEVDGLFDDSRKAMSRHFRSLGQVRTYAGRMQHNRRLSSRSSTFRSVACHEKLKIHGIHGHLNSILIGKQVSRIRGFDIRHCSKLLEQMLSNVCSSIFDCNIDLLK
jgi:hypothetical protein